MTPDIRTTVVVPAFDEARRLPESLKQIADYLDGRSETFEILVVDDGSSDGTADVARRFADRGVGVISFGANRGKGAAVRAGVLASRGRQVLITDADLSTPIDDLATIEPYLDEAPIVFGSRAKTGAEITVRQPRARELMGRCFNLIIRMLGMGGMRDTQCGFKLLDGAVARALFATLTIDRFAYDVELLCRARRAGLRVVDVGVRWAHADDSKVSPFSDAFRMFWDVLRIRCRDLKRAPEPIRLPPESFEVPSRRRPAAKAGSGE